MRITHIVLLFLCCTGIFGGCANQAMNYTMSSWQNRQVAEVIAAWGEPSEKMILEGKQLLIWSGTKQPAHEYDVRPCIRLLKADRNGRITEGTWDGNDCPGWFSGWFR